MGVDTRADIILQGATLAGRTDAGVLTNAIAWLNDWLRSQYQAWPWPFLMQRRSGLVLPAGTQTILVGGGNSGITEQVKRVEDGFYLRTADYGHRSKPRLRAWKDGPQDYDPDMTKVSTEKGPPEWVQVRAGPSPANGVWELLFYPVTDKQYVLNFDYQFMPAPLASGASVPLYPNDRTMKHAVAMMTLLFSNGADDATYKSMSDTVGGMAIDDRVKSGHIPGTNDTWGLDGGVFR